ncbi:MAG: hypothetical protein U0T83_11005 [Bacteriovoracaceae bacterium]
MRIIIVVFLYQVLVISNNLIASEPIQDKNCLKAALMASANSEKKNTDLINPYFVASSLGKNLKGKFEVKNFFDEMKKCMGSMKNRSEKEIELNKILKEIGINEDFMVSAYVASAGEKEINWDNLPPELSIDSADELLNTYFEKKSESLFLKYFNVATTQANPEEQINGTFYYFNSVNKMDKDIITKKKGEYRTSWNEQNALVKIKIANLLIGLECLYPEHKITTERNSLKFFYKGNTSYGYFILNNGMKKN